ncbi:MAG TPA: CHAT domain-containing protein [Thermoanaerobaculia bacterium]|nr:CHAT domain-containing protein [Thermoanaerobaculia bacterium]
MTPRPVFLLAALLALGCSRPPPLAVEYAGCIQVLRTGPTCLLQEGKDGAAPTITIWLPLSPSDTTTEIRIDGRPVAVAGEKALDGLRYPIEVPLAAHRLQVQRGSSSWSLALAQSPIAPAWFTEARLEASSGNLESIEKVRKELKARLPGLPPSDLSLRARVLWLLSRLPPSPGEDVVAGYRREIEARRKADHLLGEASAASALAQKLAEKDDRLAEASKVLDQVAPPSSSPAEVTFLLAFARGFVARLAGEPRQALREFEGAVAEAKRLGLESYRADAEQQLSSLLLDLGRFNEAETRFAAAARTVEATKATTTDRECAAAQVATNRGWTRLLAREAGTDVGDPLPELIAARAAFDRTAACDASHQRANARLNLALAHLQGGALDAAAEDLAQARSLSAATATAEEQLWQGEIEARLALARGRTHEALVRWQGLETNARRSGSFKDLWLALTGRARAERALGNADAALQELAEAEDLLDRQAATAQRPSRARFVEQREASARLRIELLLEQGRTAEALSAARRSRARVLRQIEMEGRIEGLSGAQRERWQQAVGDFRAARRKCDKDAAEEWSAAADRLPLVRSARNSQCMGAEENLETAVAQLGLGAKASGAESFRPPGVGELVLAFHPLDKGWVAFAKNATGVSAHRFELPPSTLTDPNDLSARLLAPFADAIRHARRIRLLPYGALREVDLHILPFDGAPLLAGRPVVYGLDLLDRAPAPALAASKPAALVIGDPRRDLPSSRKEAERVGRALADAGWQVEKESGDGATVDRMIDALPRISLLHFAGHGVAGSADGGGELLLGGEERLLATEILNLDRAPARIVLSGCATGLSDPGAAVEGLGLAQAFLLRGATQVVAAIRPVPDPDAAALFAAFYQPPPKGSADLDLAVRLAWVQAAALRNNPKSAAASFRVFEP